MSEPTLCPMIDTYVAARTKELEIKLASREQAIMAMDILIANAQDDRDRAIQRTVNCEARIREAERKMQAPMECGHPHACLDRMTEYNEGISCGFTDFCSVCRANEEIDSLAVAHGNKIGLERAEEWLKENLLPKIREAECAMAARMANEHYPIFDDEIWTIHCSCGWSEKCNERMHAKLFADHILSLSPDPTWLERKLLDARIEQIGKCCIAVSSVFSPMGPSSQGLWNMLNDWLVELTRQRDALKTLEDR